MEEERKINLKGRARPIEKVRKEKGKMKLYAMVLRIIGTVLTLILGWLVLCPILISAPSDVLVVVGIAMIIVVPVIAYLIVRPLYKALRQKVKAETEKYWTWRDVTTGPK
jgi:uncharacterized protein YacL